MRRVPFAGQTAGRRTVVDGVPVMDDVPVVDGAMVVDGVPADPVRVVVADPGCARVRDEAAAIWAAATAARDGHAEPAPLTEARAVMDAALDTSPGAVLLLAIDSSSDRDVVGFAAIGSGQQGEAEVRYLGVLPSAWGRKVAGRILAALPDLLRERGFADAVLAVYADNAAAIAAYRRAGWTPAGPPTPHPRTGRAEQRYRLNLARR